VGAIRGCTAAAGFGIAGAIIGLLELLTLKPSLGFIINICLLVGSNDVAG
jgi:hypothetical protein